MMDKIDGFDNRLKNLEKDYKKVQLREHVKIVSIVKNKNYVLLK